MDYTQAVKAQESLFLFILLLTVISGYFIHRYRLRLLTEGSVALLFGVAAAAVITFSKITPPRDLINVGDGIFQGLLPPIIFYAGFSVKKKLFFQNFLTLCSFGVLGTMISTALITSGVLPLFSWLGFGQADATYWAMTLGALMSSTDTVSALQVINKDRFPVLYSLVFGEGVVNDATAIVLLSALSTKKGPGVEQRLLEFTASFAFMFACSTILGVAFGLASALLVRRIFGRRHSTDAEVLVVGVLGLLAYIAADTLGLSAILAVFFCGITMSHYTWHNLAPAAQTITLHTFRIIASVAEKVLFAYSGLDVGFTVFAATDRLAPAQFASLAVLAASLLALLMASRAAFVFPVCWASNLWRTRNRLSNMDAVVLWWGGLARGAITLALTYMYFDKKADDGTGAVGHSAGGMGVGIMGGGEWSVGGDAASHVGSVGSHVVSTVEDIMTEEQRRLVVLAVIAVVMLTTVPLSMLNAPLIEALLERREKLQLHWTYSTDLDTPLLLPQPGVSETGAASAEQQASGSASGSAEMERSAVHLYWSIFDKQVMQPFFGGRHHRPLTQASVSTNNFADT